ncbi:MAG TPA: hypothetical protein VGC80_05370, partial [Acetobacteraceae bacterium]
RRLCEPGANLRTAHIAITELAAKGRTICDVSRHADFARLATDLRPVDVIALRRSDDAGFEPVAVPA